MVYTSPPRSDRESNRLRRSYHVDLPLLREVLNALSSFITGTDDS